MIWALLTAVVGCALFLWLYIREAIAHGQTKNENDELKRNVDVQQKQLEIAANDTRSPNALADRMRKGDL